MEFSKETKAHTPKTKLFVGIFLVIAFGVLLYVVKFSTESRSRAFDPESREQRNPKLKIMKNTLLKLNKSN